MVTTGKKGFREHVLDLAMVVALFLIIIGLMVRQFQALLPLASLLLVLRIHLSGRDGNLRRITGALLVFFGASFISNTAWYWLPTIINDPLFQTDNYYYLSGMFWLVGYVAVAWALVNLKNSKQWYLERGLDRLVTAIGALTFLAILLYTLINLPLKNGHIIDLPIALAYLSADVILLLETLKRTRREKQRWPKYLTYAGSLFFAANVVGAAYLLISLPVVNPHAIDIFILLAYLFTDVVILTMALKLVQMKLPWELKYLVYTVFLFFAINTLGDLVFETRFLYHLKYLFSLTVGGAQLTLLTADATDLIYNLSLLITTFLLFLYAPISFLTPVRDDIRKRLSDTQLFVDDLIAKSPDATCIYDREGRLLLVNDRFLDIYGLRREAVTGGQFNIFGHVGSRMFRQDVFEELYKVRKGETVILPKVKMPGIPGGRQGDFYIFLKMFPTYGSDGQVANYVLIIEDITQRALAEELLKASERRNAALLDAIPDLMFVISPEGDYLDFMAHDEGLLAISPEQIIGKNIRDAGFDAAMLASFRDHLKTAVETRQLQQLDYVLAVPSGLRSFEARLVALTDREVLCIVRDITERKQAAEALRESEEKFRALAETAPVAICILQDGKFKYTNPAMGLISGYDRGELSTINFLELVYPEFRQYFAGRYLDWMKGDIRGELRSQLKGVRKDGMVAWADLSLKPIDYEGQPALLLTGVDITERKLAEEALRQSEEKFRALNETAPVAICILQDGKFKYVNPAMETISGYSEGELLRLDFMDMVHPSARPYIEGRYGAWLGGDSEEFRSRFMGVRKDGKACWIDLSRKTIDYEGRPALLLTGVDITERVQAEAALRESEEKFRTMAEEISDWICEVDEHFVCIYSSPRVKDILGYEPDEIVGRSTFDFLAPGETDRLMATASPGFGQENRFDVIELRLRRKDGSTIWIEARGRSVVDSEGRFKCNRATITDITERKQAEEALRESEASLARAQMIAHLGSWENDYVNNTSWWSDELYNVAGLDRRRFPPTFARFMDLVHPEDRARVEGALNATQNDGRPYNIDFRIVRPDGTERTLHSEGEVAYGRDGRPVKIFGISQDITERVRLEKELLNAYNSLKEMYERKIDFTNAAAHELRTPLTPIIGYTDILKSEVKDERHRKFLAIIERNALRQKVMVNSLLELASLDAGMMQVRRRGFGVLPLASEVADNYRTINSHIAVDVSPGLAISTDPEILRHVLDNLVSNAVKYSDPAREVVIRARESGGGYLFSVTDHGPGIPREEWGKIFERFYLIGGDRDNRTGGRIGLGLALVKAYVSLLGGEVWLESELGLGSTFYFTVPKAP